MTAFLVDPVANSLERVAFSGEAGPEDPLLLGSAVEEGACAQDFVACARLVAGTANGFDVNAYTLWENNRGRAVLFVGNLTPEDRHGFRIGRPGKAVRSTAFFGKGVILRYEKTQQGIHRDHLVSGSLALRHATLRIRSWNNFFPTWWLNPCVLILVKPHADPGGPNVWKTPTLPAPRRLQAWEEKPTVEWVEGEPSRFSLASGAWMTIEKLDGELVSVMGGRKELSVCAHCRSSNPSLLKCRRCQRIKYCDRACQKAHWRVHKNDCFK